MTVAAARTKPGDTHYKAPPLLIVIEIAH